jgi:hypothetical protein
LESRNEIRKVKRQAEKFSFIPTKTVEDAKKLETILIKSRKPPFNKEQKGVFDVGSVRTVIDLLPPIAQRAIILDMTQFSVREPFNFISILELPTVVLAER